MKRIVRMGLLVASVAACSKPKAEASVQPAPAPAAAASMEHTDEAEHDELPKRVRVPAAVLQDAKVQWAPVRREMLVPTLTLPGEVMPDPDKSGRVSSPVAGRIEQVTFKEGAVVKKGDPLAVVRVPDLGRIRGAYAAATSRARAARTNAERLKALVDQRLAASQAYLDAQAEAESFDAESRALGEQLRAMGAGNGAASDYLLPLRAPVSGVVVHRDAVVGQPVTADQTLGSVADLQEAWFIGRVFEKDLGRLRLGARAEVELNAYPHERFEGSIQYLGQQIDPVARTVTARIVLTNRENMLRLGLFGQARVAIGEDAGGAPSLVVPRSALTEVTGKPVVFVHHPDDDFELHEVVLGASAPGQVEVTAGLREGEEVVTGGVFTLKSVVLKSTLAEDE